MSASPPPAMQAKQQRSTWIGRILSLPTVMGAALIEILFAYSNHGGKALSIADPDIWWHLRDAAHLVHTGHFIRADAWTFTVGGKPWINFEWLAELPYYAAYQWIGNRGVYLVMMALMCGIILGIYLLAWMRSGDWLASFGAAFVAILFATVSLGPRTLLFGWFYLVIELGILWGFERGHDYTPWLAPLFLVWINTHGSWFIGFVLMLVFFACGWVRGEWGNLYAVAWTPKQRRKLLAVIGATIPLLFVNPYGWRLVVYPLNVVFQQKGTMEYITEWASLDFHTGRGKVVLATLMLVGILQLIRRRRWPLQDFLMAGIGIYGALTHVRFVFLAGILLAPVLAIDLARPQVAAARQTKDRRLLAGAALAVLAAMTGMYYPTRQELRASIAAQYPEKAVPYLRSLAGHGNLFNNFNWGGFVEWEAPRVKTFIDPRVDIFVHHGIMKAYVEAADVKEPFAVFDKYDIRYALLAPDSSLAYLLSHSPGWKITWKDKLAVIFERTQ